MVTAEMQAYAQLLRNRGYTENRAIRALQRRFPTLETCHALEAWGHVPEPGLWSLSWPFAGANEYGSTRQYGRTFVDTGVDHGDWGSDRR